MLALCSPSWFIDVHVYLQDTVHWVLQQYHGVASWLPVLQPRHLPCLVVICYLKANHMYA
jgi:hypothetical protein